MRIIGGKYKGRRLHPPAGLKARPTTDMAREGLFNVLGDRIHLEGKSVLDLFFGSGAMALEFLSRGASHVTAVDNQYISKHFLYQTAREWGEENLKVVKADVFKLISKAKGKFDLVFADPPYAHRRAASLPDLVLGAGWLEPGDIFILEHGPELNFEKDHRLNYFKQFGNVRFSFFEMPRDADSEADQI